MGELPLIAGQVFNSFSVASLFVLAALGLALSFGLMRVINMAHGEMLMLGGYLAYLVFLVVPGPLAIFVAMPVAFIGAAPGAARTGGDGDDCRTVSGFRLVLRRPLLRHAARPHHAPGLNRHRKRRRGGASGQYLTSNRDCAALRRNSDHCAAHR